MADFDYLPPERAFLDGDRKGAGRPELAQAVIIPFGLEKSLTYEAGTARGPGAILKASKEVELYDEEFSLEIVDSFEVATLAAEPIAETHPAALDQIEKIVKKVLEAGKFPLVLGGEHSLTIGAHRPFIDKYSDLVILQFDAHADLRDGYLGNSYSHASAMRRVLDEDRISLVSVGIRNISLEEAHYVGLNKNRIHHFWARGAGDWEIGDIVAPLRGKPVYVTFDVDCFDSSLMPATGTPEPGGLFWQEAIDVLRAASEAGTIVGGDIVELSPRAGLHACDFLTAKLAYKLLAYALGEQTW